MKVNRGDEIEEMTAQQVVDRIGGILSSGQGHMDYEPSTFYGGWKGRDLTELVEHLTPEEKREVWNGLNTPERIEIGDGEGDGTYPNYEVQFLSEILGIKIKIIPSRWEEE